MSLLLDTATCLDLIRGDQPAVRARFAERLARDPIAVSAITLMLLAQGVAAAPRALRGPHAVRLASFRQGPLQVLGFDEADAEATGLLGALLEGRPRLGTHDLMLAGQAQRRGWALVTSNRRLFNRVPGLALEDWRTA